MIKQIIKHSVYDPTKTQALSPLLTTMAHEIGSNNYMNQLHAIIGRQDQTKLLTSIECPTLLLAGKNDKVIPIDCAQQMAMDIKNAELFYIEECGHMAMLEQPKIINQILSGWL